MPRKCYSNKHLIILKFIIRFKAQNNGLSPTIQEIADEFHTSKSVVKFHLHRLVQIGAIELYGNGASRSIMIPNSEWRMIPEVKEITEQENKS
jgi:DNA-binding MarR family transcriptional regulator